MKKLLMILSALVLITTVVPALVAQESNTSSATAGVFASDADDFIDVLGYMNLGLKSSFLDIGLQNSSDLEIGTGFLLGTFYLGAYYTGDILYQNGGSFRQDVESTLLLNGAYQVIGEQVVTSDYWISRPYTYSYNDISVLLGFAGMGIKIGFNQYSSREEDKYAMINVPSTNAGGTLGGLGYSGTGGYNSDARTEIKDAAGTLQQLLNVVEYTGGNSLNENLVPSIEWGMPIKLANLVLKPRVQVSTDFNTTTFTTNMKTYDAALGSGQPTFDGVSEADNVTDQSYSYQASNYGLKAQAAFDVDIGDPKKSVVGFGVLYKLDLPLYQNSYEDLGGTSQSFAGVASWYEGTTYAYNGGSSDTTVVRAFRLDDTQVNNHNIIPGFRLRGKVGERLQLGLDLNADISIDSSIVSTSGSVSSVATHTDFGSDPAQDSVTTITREFSGARVESTSFGVSPALNGALRFDLIPGTLSLNLGTSVSLPSVYQSNTTYSYPGFDTTTTVTAYGNGTQGPTTVTSNLADSRSESNTQTFNIENLALDVHGGLTFTLGDGFSLDLLMNNSGMSLDATTLSIQLNYKN